MHPNPFVATHLSTNEIASVCIIYLACAANAFDILLAPFETAVVAEKSGFFFGQRVEVEIKA